MHHGIWYCITFFYSGHLPDLVGATHAPPEPTVASYIPRARHAAPLRTRPATPLNITFDNEPRNLVLYHFLLFRSSARRCRGGACAARTDSCVVHTSGEACSAPTNTACHAPQYNV